MLLSWPKPTILPRLAATIVALLCTPALPQHTPPTTAAHLFPPSELRCADQSEPLAVADAHPEFSWQLSASSTTLHGVNQTAYQIQIAESEQNLTQADSVLWDSGIVHASDTSGIVYAGPALTPQRAYVWKVRVWDEQGRLSAWSHVAHWTQAPAWHAQWIAANPTESVLDPDSLPLFRKRFTLQKPIKRALLYASGLGQDELRLNGHKVGDDVLTPGWSDYRKTVYYDSYEVTNLLHGGENALGVLLGNGMYRVLHTSGRYTKFTGSYGPPKCAVLLHLEFAEGNSLDLSSDNTWKTTPGPITFSSTYGGEDFDARREPQGWDGPGFDDSKWHSVALVDGPGGTMMPELAPPIRVIRSYASLKQTHPKPGIVVYDLGQNFAGWPEILAAGPPGAVVKLTPGELLNPDGTVSQRSSGRPQWFSYTLRGAGIETWHPRFSDYGFRYVQIESRSEPRIRQGAHPGRAR